MRIDDCRVKEGIPVKSLHMGDLFERFDLEGVWMVVVYIDGDGRKEAGKPEELRVVSLADGGVRWMDREDLVKPLDSEMVSLVLH